MKISFLPVWLVAGVFLVISRLAAQDVTVTDPAWFDSENAPADQLPTFKKKPKPDYPDELKKADTIAYAIVAQSVDEQGGRMGPKPVTTNLYLDKAIMEAGVPSFKPAVKNGKAAPVNCWYSIIFNPKAASVKKDNAIPRLVAVAPVIVAQRELPAGTKIPLIITAKLKLGEKGQLMEFDFENPAYEVLRGQVGASLYNWRFAPARQEGKPVAADLNISLIVLTPMPAKKPGTPPKVVHKEPARYPRDMLNSRMRGEVLLEFTVDKDGSVKNPVVKQTNNPGFNEAAFEAIRQWKFEPGRLGGEPVAAKMQVPISFEITGGGPVNDAVTVESKGNQDKLPEKYRYDVAPQPKGVLAPIYPYSLLVNKTEGKATVAFLINPDGDVSAVQVTSASHPEFGLAMMAAVEAFKFIPALRGGKPTQTILKMEQKFEINGMAALVSERGMDLAKLEKKHPEKIIPDDKLDAPLKSVSRHGPVFPVAVQGKATEGNARVEVLVDDDGKVYLPRIIEADDPAFGYAAVQAVSDWRYESPKAGGKAVVARVKVLFKFKAPRQAVLKPDDTP